MAVPNHDLSKVEERLKDSGKEEEENQDDNGDYASDNGSSLLALSWSEQKDSVRVA